MSGPGGLVAGGPDPSAWTGFVAALGDGGTRLLPQRGLVVVPEHRQPGGWRCTVIARRASVGAGDDRWHADVTEQEWAAGASGTVTVDPDGDADAAALLWLVRVWQRWPGRRVYLLGRHVVEVFRQPGRLEVELSTVAMRRLCHHSGMRPDLVGRVLDRLTTAGYLTPVGATGRRVYRLSLPPACLDATAAVGT